MRYIVGMEPAESQVMLDFLRAHMNDARFHVRWRWEPGDLAIWDERSTNHRAVGDSGEQERVIRRIEIDGTRPFYDPAL
jgi:taurine dioxygenase